MGWGEFLDDFLDLLPIQKRKERWKNQLDDLKKEEKLLKKGPCNAKKVKRLLVISQRIDKLNRLLRNAVTD